MLIETDENNYCTGNIDIATIGSMINYVYVEKLPDDFEDLLKFKSYKCIIAPNESSDEDGVPYSVTYEFDSARYDELKLSYEKEERKAYVKNKIETLQEEYDKSNSQILECAACSILGLDSPYDVADLHTKRKEIRDEITCLESELKNMGSEL